MKNDDKNKKYDLDVEKMEKDLEKERERRRVEKRERMEEDLDKEIERRRVEERKRMKEDLDKQRERRRVEERERMEEDLDKEIEKEIEKRRNKYSIKSLIKDISILKFKILLEKKKKNLIEYYDILIDYILDNYILLKIGKIFLMIYIGICCIIYILKQ